MKSTFVKCEYCKTDICNQKGKCIFAVYKRVIDSIEYQFCCEAHADRFEKEKRKKRK